MSEDEEKSKGFKVQDRRRFSPEGEARPENRGPEEEPVAAPEINPTLNAGAHAKARDAYAKASSQASEQREPDEITFASFVVGLSTEALALLGEIPHPATGERVRDLGAAQQIIDILGILREKTRSNLNRDEESLMDAVLFDLRMKYVEIARQASR